MLVLKFARIAIAAVAVAGVVVPTLPAAATKTICVGLVVDARPLAGPVSADCTKVPDGSTGYDVLRAAGHTVGFRQDGLICTIDNRPASGCSATDDTHFWAYFHRAPKSSSWTMSNEGATTYKPANGTTEGWVWRNGGNATPDNVPYSTICPQTASPSPKPTPSPTHAIASTTPTVAATTKPTAAVHHPKQRSKVTHSVARKHQTTPTPTAATTSSPPVTIAAAHSTASDGSSGPPWGLIAGASAVVVVGGAAAWRFRRRESE